MPRDEQGTLSLSEDRLARLRAQRRETASQVALSIYHRDGVELVPLEEGGTVTIGRYPPSDVVLREESLSRRHAGISVSEGEVWVEDLQSTNGTTVGGRRVTRARVPIGAEVTFGAVSAIVHPLGPAPDDIVGHERFVRRLGKEVARARTFGRPASLLVLRPVRPAAAGRWTPAVLNALRPFDCVGLYSTNTIEILRPEETASEARDLALSLALNGEPLLVGLAGVPEHAGSAEELVTAARAALRTATAADPVATAPSRITRDDLHAVSVEGAVFASPAMKAVARTARHVASSRIPVLIQGETGTGKEVVAHLLATSGSRAHKPLVAVNCAAIPDSLLESTLFGHVRGAFTNAIADRRGVFEAADGGTIFLDEVSELAAPAQAALLRVLETGRFQRVGSTVEIEVDVRVLAATNTDLEEATRDGRFREDLLYRLNAMTIEIPPLRERREEIPPLVHRFMSQANDANDRQIQGIERDALASLGTYDWPGNVRELKNTIERAVVIAYSDVISLDDLPRKVRAKAASRGVPPNVFMPQEPPDQDLRDDLARYEAQRIRAALDAVEWRREDAARRLGLPVRTLFRRMRQLGIVEA